MNNNNNKKNYRYNNRRNDYSVIKRNPNIRDNGRTLSRYKNKSRSFNVVIGSNNNAANNNTNQSVNSNRTTQQTVQFGKATDNGYDFRLIGSKKNGQLNRHEKKIVKAVKNQIDAGTKGEYNSKQRYNLDSKRIKADVLKQQWKNTLALGLVGDRTADRLVGDESVTDRIEKALADEQEK